MTSTSILILFSVSIPRKGNANNAIMHSLQVKIADKSTGANSININL